MMNLIEALNPIQAAAVQQTEGPVMIIAGAGSGKTRVLTYRIAYLLEQGINPFQILALTFTNKAAREMKERIGLLVGETNARNLWMGTFHSIFSRILRVEAEKLGFPSQFTIYDTDDAKSLIKSVVEQMKLDEKIYKPSLVLNRISAAKNNLILPPEYARNADILEEDRLSGKPQLALIYQAYQDKLFKASAMDFDDLLVKTNLLFKLHPETLYKYQHRFRYILVDEYQDTNYCQYLIVKKLAAAHLNICVVGDDAQSIYAFRGANIQNILNFEKDYPDLKVFKLEQNYRSSKHIVEAANNIIKNNEHQLKKKVFTENPQGDKIQVLEASTDNEEAQLIANAIFSLKMNKQLPNQAFAILYRTNAQSRALEEWLRKKNIPYRIYGGLSFYKRKEIKDLLAYFRLCINFQDEEALKRIINYPARGIGKSTMEHLEVLAAENKVSLWEAMEEAIKNASLRGAVAGKINGFQTMIKSFAAQMDKLNAYELALHISRSSGLYKELEQDKTPEGVSRMENIEELLNGIQEFAEAPFAEGEEPKMRRLDEFMQDVALLTDADEDDKDGQNHKVSLMTVHAAKGLEFPCVFVAGLEENLFPSQMALYNQADLEEERRLFYVAVTRAEKYLYLSYAQNRYRYGNIVHAEPSRFVSEISEQYLEYAHKQPAKQGGIFSQNDEPWGSWKKNGPSPLGGNAKTSNTKTADDAGRPNLPSQKPIVPSAPNDPSFLTGESLSLVTGMRVEHQRFGSGKVLHLEGKTGEQKATIFFENIGIKQLLLKFAKLKIIE